MGLHVLITNIELWPPSGTVVYVRDLALELQRQGHAPVVFSLPVGVIARELRDAGIPVTDSLRHLAVPPDIIHGHHFAQTMLAVRHWPAVPAINVCHDHDSTSDRTPLHPRIRRHFGVSRVCVERLVRGGVAASRARLLLNFVDTERFLPRSPLPERPRRALVFSNYAHGGTHLPAVSDACRRAGLELDVVGAGVGNTVVRPELLLGQYDIVFAKGKAAMEAMAVGAAVVLCDSGGVGPMITAAEFDDLRPLNFGYKTLRAPLQPEPLLTEIARYDPQDAARVRDRLRACASLPRAVRDLVDIYREVISEQESAPPRAGPTEPHLLRERLLLRVTWAWKSLPVTRRDSLRRLPGVRKLEAGVKRLLVGNA